MCSAVLRIFRAIRDSVTEFQITGGATRPGKGPVRYDRAFVSYSNDAGAVLSRGRKQALKCGAGFSLRGASTPPHTANSRVRSRFCNTIDPRDRLK